MVIGHTGVGVASHRYSVLHGRQTRGASNLNRAEGLSCERPLTGRRPFSNRRRSVQAQKLSPVEKLSSRQRAISVRPKSGWPPRDCFLPNLQRALAERFGLGQHKRPRIYSMISSARAKSEGGTARPSAFAVCTLITSLTSVACSTGRSLGLAPRSILSMYSAPRTKPQRSSWP